MSAMLVLIGSYGDNTFNVKQTPTPVRTIPWGFKRNVVNLTRATARRQASLTTWSSAQNPGDWVGDVVVDDSTGTAARDATYAASDHAVLRYQHWLGSREETSALTGVAGGDAQIHIIPHLTGNVLYKAPEGLANTMTVDLDVRSPLPEGNQWDPSYTGAFSYDGGYSGGDDPESLLTVVGLPAFWGWPTDSPFASELHVADGASSGLLAFAHPSGVRGAIAYAGLSPLGLHDLVPVADYRFDYRGSVDPGVAIMAGEPTANGLGTLLVASRATPPTFVGTTLANKTNVVVDTHGSGVDHSTLVDYTAEEPVAGLASLTIVTSLEDQVLVATPPPGVSVIVDSTTTPRPEEEVNPPSQGGDGGERDNPPRRTQPPAADPSSPVEKSSDDPPLAPASAQTVEDPLVLIPTPVGPDAPKEPDAQIVGRGPRPTIQDGDACERLAPRIGRRGFALRTSRARMAHLEALRARRNERVWAARTSLSK